MCKENSVDVNCERDTIAIKEQYIVQRKENSIKKLRPDLAREWDYKTIVNQIKFTIIINQRKYIGFVLFADTNGNTKCVIEIIVLHAKKKSEELMSMMQRLAHSFIHLQMQKNYVIFLNWILKNKEATFL